MADELSKREPQDAARINVNKLHEVRYWTQTLDFTEQQLRSAVAAAGVEVNKIRTYVRLRWRSVGPYAQQPSGLGRTDVLQHDLGIAGREVVQVRVDFAPGVLAPRHSHPGVEVAYVLEGTIEYQIDGKPPVTLRKGEALFIPDGAIHSARNVGDSKASELATYIVEKGKPGFMPAK